MRNVIEETNGKQVLAAGREVFRNATAMIKGLPYVPGVVSIGDAEPKEIVNETVDLSDLETSAMYFGNIKHSYNEHTYELRLFLDLSQQEDGRPYMCTSDEMCENIFNHISKYNRISKVVMSNGVLLEILKASLAKGYYTKDDNGIIVEVDKHILCMSRLFGRVVEVYNVISLHDSHNYILGDFVNLLCGENGELKLNNDYREMNFLGELSTDSKITSNPELATGIFNMVSNMEKSLSIQDDYDSKEEMVGDEDGDDETKIRVTRVRANNTPTGVLEVYANLDTGHLTSTFVPDCHLDENGEYVHIMSEDEREVLKTDIVGVIGTIRNPLESVEESDFCMIQEGTSLFECMEKAEVNIPYTEDRIVTFIDNILEHSIKDKSKLDGALLEEIVDAILNKNKDEFNKFMDDLILPQSILDKINEVKDKVSFNYDKKYAKLLKDIIELLITDYTISSLNGIPEIKRYAFDLVYNKYHFGNTEDMVLTENSVRHELNNLLKMVDKDGDDAEK